MFLVSGPTWHDDKNVRWMSFEAWIPIDFGCSGSGTGWKCQCLTLRSAPLSMQFRCFMAASPWRTKMPNKSKKYWLVRFISQVSFMLFNVSCGICWSFWASYQKGTAPQAAALIDWTIGFAGENFGPLSVLGMATWSLRNCVRHSHATCFMENCPCGHSMVSLILIRSTAENWKIAHYPTDGLHQLIRLMFRRVCLIQADSTHFFVTLLRPILAGWSEEASACRGQVWDVPDYPD